MYVFNIFYQLVFFQLAQVLLLFGTDWSQASLIWAYAPYAPKFYINNAFSLKNCGA